MYLGAVEIEHYDADDVGPMTIVEVANNHDPVRVEKYDVGQRFDYDHDSALFKGFDCWPDFVFQTIGKRVVETGDDFAISVYHAEDWIDGEPTGNLAIALWA